MRFASLILNGYAFVKDSGISEISVTFTEDVQVIIGTNGSGKSSILRQLSAYPAPRTNFDKKGFKSQVIQKDGVYYRLESEFEKPSSPHLFFKGEDEDNLNVGRTSETQKELIAEHLGITQLVDDLILNRYTFPKWTPSKRKEFLMGSNPAQIGFVLGLIKQTASKIKACKNNLSRLQSRKILLEQDLLDDDTLASLNAEKQVISDELGAFQQNLMDIELGLRTVKDNLTLVSLEDLPKLKKTVQRYHYQLVHLRHVNRDDQQRQRDREFLLTKIAVCVQNIENKDAEILDKSAKLVDLEVKYRELSFDGDLQNIDNTIQRLEAERDRLQVTRPMFELSEAELQSKYSELDTLRDRLGMFSQLSVTLLPTKRRQHRERMLSSAQYKQSSYNMRLSDLKTQYEDLSKRHNLKPRDIPDSPCAKDACPLYAHFMGEYTNTEERRQKLTNSIQKGERKIARLNTYVEGLITHRNNAQPYVDQIQWLVGYAQTNPILHHVLRNMDILVVLSTNPNRIVLSLQDEYDRIGQWIKLKAVNADLETAYSLRSRQLSLESSDTVKLVSTIEEVKATLYELRTAIYTLVRDKKILDKQLSDITTFSTIKENMLIIQRQHNETVAALADQHEKGMLTFLRKNVEELRARHFLRMSEIERTLRAQSGLRERYQEEVVSQIGQIEKEMTDLQQMESALIVIPKENMIDFINSLFKQANKLIETIWTVPLKIELLEHSDVLNYEFYVTGDNHSVREMAECSEGQTEILSLTINLALRIILGHVNIPLCLDEAGRTFDEQHRNNFIVLLRRLLKDKVISQLFMVSHNALIHEGFNDIETMVIREDNIMLPEKYNQHVTFA